MNTDWQEPAMAQRADLQEGVNGRGISFLQARLVEVGDAHCWRTPAEDNGYHTGGGLGRADACWCGRALQVNPCKLPLQHAHAVLLFCECPGRLAQEALNACHQRRRVQEQALEQSAVGALRMFRYEQLPLSSL